MAYIDSANIKGTLYELQDTQARTDVGDLKSATTALETYVRDMSPVAYGNDEGIPVPIVTVRDAAPLNAEDVSFEIEPLQDGSGNPSPSNVRPITGWTEAKVYRTGKNLFNPSNVIKGFVNTSTHKIAYSANARTVYAPCKPNTTYTISKMAGSRFMVAETAEEPGANVVTDNIVAKNTASSITITTSTTARYLAAYVWAASDVSISANDMLASVQIELGSTATDYEPYQGNTFDITFPSEAGTVYGGTVDLTRGKLVVDRGYIASYDGETLPGAWISSMDVYTPGRTPTTGAQVVYTLASAVEYNLTPQEIEMLKGVNNLWANTGDISVQYRQDVYTALNNKINALEALVLENMN